ncbi:hypothetical protein BDW71DRAFT_171169 [Aspergillus fruticulosus]
MPIIIELERYPGVTGHPRFILFVCGIHSETDSLWNRTRSAMCRKIWDLYLSNQL